MFESHVKEMQDVLEGRRRWCLLMGDCVQLLPLLPDRVVTHVITDPPYTPRTMRNARRNGAVLQQRREGKIYDFGYGALTDTLRSTCTSEFARLAKRWALVWCDIEGAHPWRTELEQERLRYVRTGIWFRVHSTPQFSGDRPAQGVEACVITHAPRTRLRWNGGGKPATWVHPIVNSQADEREHSTPKPLPLMLEQIAQFTDPDDIILDPFAGSGTTGAACLRLGRRFIGMEVVPRFATYAAERLAAEEQGLSVRSRRAGQLPLFDAGELAMSTSAVLPSIPVVPQ